jgi:hypothetical protein
LLTLRFEGFPFEKPWWLGYMEVGVVQQDRRELLVHGYGDADGIDREAVMLQVPKAGGNEEWLSFGGISEEGVKLNGLASDRSEMMIIKAFVKLTDRRLPCQADVDTPSDEKKESDGTVSRKSRRHADRRIRRAERRVLMSRSPSESGKAQIDMVLELNEEQNCAEWDEVQQELVHTRTSGAECAKRMRTNGLAHVGPEEDREELRLQWLGEVWPRQKRAGQQGTHFRKGLWRQRRNITPKQNDPQQLGITFGLFVLGSTLGSTVGGAAGGTAGEHSCTACR